MKNKIIFSVIGVIVFTILVGIVSVPGFLYDPCRNIEEQNSLEFSGIVVAKYVDRIPKLELDTSASCIIHFAARPLWDSSRVGDSIVKKRGGNEVFLYRNGEIMNDGKAWELFRQNEITCEKNGHGSN